VKNCFFSQLVSSDLTQAKSLFYDHDLDIKNNLMEEMRPEERETLVSRRANFHIVPNSRNKHWYSWHPYGLPLIAAPFWKGGLTARHLILSLIAALGCLGSFLLCRRSGAGISGSLMAVFAMGGSVYWSLYSARFLPEVLGATLLC